MSAHPAAHPLVSVVMPVFNGERYLRQCLDSVIAQIYCPIEILVMDDASTDGTSEIVAGYGDKVRFLRQPRNRGIYGNMNDGIRMAQGKYIAFYHSDDVYLPTIVERGVEFLERYPEAGAVFCQDIFIDPEGRKVARLEIPREVRGGRPLEYSVIFNALLRYKNVFLRCPSCMVRAAVYRDVGTYRDSEFLNTSDLEMWLRIARKYPIGILEEHLFCYRYGHGSSAQRYHHLRTDPSRFFRIMDLYLEDGGRELAVADALDAYEAHRAEDGLMRAISHYILGQRHEALDTLRGVRSDRIYGSRKVQRHRLFVLYLLLQALLRLPRIPLLADLFYRRWHVKGTQAKKPLIHHVLSFPNEGKNAQPHLHENSITQRLP